MDIEINLLHYFFNPLSASPTAVEKMEGFSILSAPSIRLNGFNNISLYPYNEYKNIVNWYDPIYKAINFNLDND